MSKAQVRGISGLLDSILSPPSQAKPAAVAREANHQSEGAEFNPPKAVENLPLAASVRRGRPPGRSRLKVIKEKLTVRIESGLIGTYRDWTWQSRCQLSDLVELALADYHRRNREQPPPP